jgi:tetratricopeptide (TPR) repeat protein
MEPLLSLAHRAYRDGHITQAEALCRQALGGTPSDAEAWFLLGSICRDLRKPAEAIEAFRLAVHLRPDDAEARAGLGLFLAGRRELAEAVVHLREAARLCPESAPARYNLGVALAESGELGQAEACFRDALRLNPNYAAAHNGLGNVLRDFGRFDEAVASYREALKHLPGRVDIYNNLGQALIEARRPDEAIDVLRQGLRLRPQVAGHGYLGLALTELGYFTQAEVCYHEALRLNPGYAETHGGLGNAYRAQGRIEEALACYEVVLRQNPEDGTTRWNRALAWLQAGDYERGWAEYEWRWRRKQARPRQLPQAVWDGSPLAGRTLLLHMEQGIGDMIQFIRYAPLVKGGRVVVECPGSLVPLFASCPGIDRLVAEGDALPEYDVRLPLLSLPHRLGTTLATVPANVPYLAPPAERVERWRAAVVAVGGFKVGIVWQGNPLHPRDRHRSAPLAALAPLAKVPGVRLIRLQKGPGTEQLRATGLGFPVVELAEELDAAGGFLDTAAVMKHLDLVVTVDTAAAHLAGALAVPVWLALSVVCDWRWMTKREDSPWYPTMRLFRQDRLGEWGPVFGRMADAVRER